MFAKLLLTVCPLTSGSELITSWKHCSVRRGQHWVTVRTSFAPTSAVAQCLSWCSAPTTGQAWCLLSSCCCLLLGVQKSDAVACFLDEDIKEPNYDWDSAPGFDLDNVYKPPILCQHVYHSNHIHHTSTGNSDNEVQEPGEVPADDDSSSDSSEGSTKRTVTNNNKGPITMNCSHHQFVYLLKNLLVFHAMYKCGPPLFGPR